MNKNVGIVDEDKARALREWDEAEKHFQNSIDYQKDNLAGCIWANKKEQILVANKSHQLGEPMHFTMLEKLIRKLPHGDNYIFFDFADHPAPELRNRPFKAVYFKGLGDVKPRMVSPYGKTILPEWTVMNVEEEYQPDMTVRHFDRKDLPRKVWKGWERGYENVDPTAPSPWKNKIVKTTGENPDDPASRGWRTVFARIVGMGLATPSQVEKLISSSSRQSWANHMGRRDDKLGY